MSAGKNLQFTKKHVVSGRHLESVLPTNKLAKPTLKSVWKVRKLEKPVSF